jgi:hypothetical protein
MILTLVIFWHINFLIAMGTIGAIVCFWFADQSGSVAADTMLIKSSVGLSNAGKDPTNAPLWNAWKIFLFGTLMGVVNYLAGLAISINQETLLKIIGFTGYSDTTTLATSTQTVSPSGVT